MWHSLVRRAVLVVTLLAVAPCAAWAQGEAPPAPPAASGNTAELSTPAPETAAAAETAAPAEAAAPAEEKPTIDKGDTTWILTSAALVLFMTPGLALFYGGMVRKKNVLGTLMQSFIAMGVVSVLWMVAGYSIAFSPGPAGMEKFVGGLSWLGLNGVSALEPSDKYATTIPHQLFMVFQMMFAIITPALISGAFAERMKFSSYLVFISAWLLLVYAPLAHWVWSVEGWLFNIPALDFAGGTVVHISSGVTALVAAIIMGKRKGYPGEEMRPHNLTMTLVGTGILWFGWFGFNGGSAVAADGIATTAFVNTHLAAAVAMMAWLFVEWAHRGKPTALGAASGAVAGLVGITPAAGFVTPMGALAIGALTSVACYAAVMYKSKLGYDDSLDTFGVHGVGGTVGAILTGVFCTKAVNSLGQDGLLYGNPGQVMNQLIGVGATWLYAGIVGGVILLAVNAAMALRVKSTEEDTGLDVTQHGEEGYAF